MATKHSYNVVLARSERIARVWTDNPTFTLGEITLTALSSKIADARQKHDQLEALRMQLTALTNDLNQVLGDLASITTRGRSGLRATYGPNSTQYEQGGGTKQSEKRKPTKKKGGGNGNSTPNS